MPECQTPAVGIAQSPAQSRDPRRIPHNTQAGDGPPRQDCRPDVTSNPANRAVSLVSGRFSYAGTAYEPDATPAPKRYPTTAASTNSTNSGSTTPATRGPKPQARPAPQSVAAPHSRNTVYHSLARSVRGWRVRSWDSSTSSRAAITKLRPVRRQGRLVSGVDGLSDQDPSEATVVGQSPAGVVRPPGFGPWAHPSTARAYALRSSPTASRASHAPAPPLRAMRS